MFPMERSLLGAFFTQKPKTPTNRLQGVRTLPLRYLPYDFSPAQPGACGGLPRVPVPSCRVAQSPGL